jgi:hypothetical protein
MTMVRIGSNKFALVARKNRKVVVVCRKLGV